MKAAALRRRWWVIVACVLAAAVAAYAVGLLRSKTSTAESVAVVSAGVITSGPGAVDQAFRLAQDYARTIPTDDRVIGYVERATGAPARARINASADDKSAVLHVGFTAPSRESAIAGAEALASGLSGKRPIAASIVPRSLSVVSRPTKAELGSSGYTAEAVLVTSSGGGPNGPGYGDQAVKLGPSYASSIADDARVLAFVAKKLGTTVDDVDDHATVKNDKDTAVLRLRYQADDDARAEKGAWAMADAVTGPAPISDSVEPGTLALVRKGDAESPSANAAITLPVGALLGLCLGLVLMLALERADPRVDDPEQLEDEFRCPSILVDEVTPSMAAALLERWAILTGQSHPTVALIPTSKELEHATAGLANRLVNAAARASQSPDAMSHDLRLVIGRYPGADLSGASVAASSDGVVLIAAEGAPLHRTTSTGQVLERFEAPPQWTVLLTRKARKSLAREPAQAERAGVGALHG
jgi:hypothetical protein